MTFKEAKLQGTRVHTNARILFFVLCAVLVSCGGNEFNINQYLVTQPQTEAFDVLKAQAEIAYNAGDFTKAAELGQKAYDINPHSEDAAVLLGYIYLALAGLEPISIIRSLVKGAERERDTVGTEGDASANGQLTIMADLLGISMADSVKMGTIPAENPSEFSDAVVVIPDLASVARQESGVASLKYLSKVVEIVCPFVDASVRIEGDPRHGVEKCPVSERVLTEKARSHYLWAFAHLGDALIFRNVVMYSTSADLSPNLQKQAAIVAQTPSTDIVTYIRLAGALASNVTQVFPLSEADSQLNAIINGLRAAALGFAAIGGGAEAMTTGIDSALKSIEDASSVGDEVGGADEALRQQMTESITSEMGEKIEELAAGKPEEFAANKEEICATYATIAGAGVTLDECED